MDIETFWKNTNNLIKARGKTQRSLALECGFTDRRIESLSSNFRSPSIIEAVVIAEKLNTTVEKLVNGSCSSFDEAISNNEDETVYKTKYEDLVAAIKRLPI